MFGWLKQKGSGSRVVGVDLYDDGCAIAVLDSSARPPSVAGVRWCAFDEIRPNDAALREAVRDLNARGLPVCATLHHSSYSPVQLEAPEMPDDELREAMRWRVRDLVDFPVEEAVIDVFRLPPSRRPGAPSLAYVVVARQADVDELAELLGAADLKVEAIDIVEMAIRNLALHIDAPGRPRAYLQMHPGQSVIEIVDGPQVYLSRRVQQDYDATADPVVLESQMENLALEVQRSLDYFESQYALGAADQLAVIVDDRALFDAFDAVARTFLTVSSVRFDVMRLATGSGVEPGPLERGVTAVGAAMRGLRWAA